MEFDITNIDKNVLLKALYEGTQAGVGVSSAEHIVRKMRGENVDVLTDDECDEALREFNNSSEPEGFRIFDYHKGKAMKIVFFRERNGRILVDSTHHDTRNGYYNFLIVMLKTFPVDQVLITKKGYKLYSMLEMKEHLKHTKTRKKQFAPFFKNAVQKKDNLGKHWILPNEISEFLKDIIV